MVRISLITPNVSKVLIYLFRNYKESFSINELARKIGITPKGTQKILLKLEDNQLVVKQKIANIIIYHLNFVNIKIEDIVKYTLKSEKIPNNYVKVIINDLQLLQQKTIAAFLFGSVLEKGLQAHDIDLCLVIQEDHYVVVKKLIQEFEIISPKRIHLLVQTKKDFSLNLQKNDSIIFEIIKKGYILWGYNFLYDVIKNDERQK